MDTQLPPRSTADALSSSSSAVDLLTSPNLIPATNDPLTIIPIQNININEDNKSPVSLAKLQHQRQQQQQQQKLQYFERYHDRVLVPPLNFAMVAPGVYRSGYPNKKNFPFLKKLGLKSVMYFSPDGYSPENLVFLQENDIKIYHYEIEGNKEPFTEIDQAVIANALVHLLDKRNHPILVHCNKGKHRVGCLVGCLRKLQNWSMTSIFDEYRRFAGTKIRIADQEFIEIFSHAVRYDPKYAPSWFGRK